MTTLASARPGDLVVRAGDLATGEVAWVGLAQVWVTWDDAGPPRSTPARLRG